MNEAEIALKTAELLNSKAWAELLNDIVKIGIPSLVAIAGITSTYFLTRASHRKDITIENLKIIHDTKKEVHSRTGELIQSINLGLTELHQITITYANYLWAKLDMSKDGLPFPEESRKELSSQYQKLVDCLHEIFAIEAQVYLLGVKRIDEQFVSYQSAVSDLSINFEPKIGLNKMKPLEEKLIEIRGLREKLFSSLSEVYLIGKNEISNLKGA